MSASIKTQKRAKIGAFVPHKGVKAVWGILERCRKERVMGMVVSQTKGRGKTTAIQQYLRKWPRNAVVLEMDVSTHSVRDLLLAIAEAYYFEDIGGQERRIFQQLVRRLRGDGRLLIIDEGEFLKPMQLEAIRRLHDLAGIGIVLFGTRELKEMITQGYGRYSLERVEDRIAYFFELREDDFFEEVVAEVLQAWGVRSVPELEPVLLTYGRQKGLRALVRRLRHAQDLADQQDGVITQADWNEAGRYAL